MHSTTNDPDFNNIIDVLVHRAEHQPNNKAFTFLANGEDVADELTFEKLENFARHIAIELSTLKAQQERAILIYPAGLDFVGVFLGCLYAGTVAVPINPPRNQKSFDPLKILIADAQAKFVLTTKEIFQLIRSHPEFDRLSKVLTFVITDDIRASSMSGNHQGWQRPLIKNDQLAFLQYTSGSTAKPKGVMISHQNLMHNLEMIKQAFHNSSETIGVGWLPHYHDMGLIGNTLEPLYLGIQVIRMPPLAFIQKPLRWLKAITHYKATTCGGPNFGYDLCVHKISDEEKADLDLSSWTLAFTGAEPIRAETLKKFYLAFRDCGFNYEAFYPCYGMAETTVFTTGGNVSKGPSIYMADKSALAKNMVKPIENEDEVQPIVGCGHSWMDQEIKLINPDSGRECLADQIGEVWIKSSSVALGYWKYPEATRKTFQAEYEGGKDTYLRSGDLGFIKDGELFITGRLKELIIVRGKNYYPQDIEKTVEESHPDLRKHAGAAFTIDVDGEEKLVIVQEIKRDQMRKANFNDLADLIRQNVSESHELGIHRLLFLRTGHVNKTSSGKIQRRLMKEKFLNNMLEPIGQNTELQMCTGETKLNAQKARAERDAVKDSMVGTIQSWLIEKIAGTLKVKPETIDVDVPIDRYGLDSIQAISISGELEKWLKCTISPTLIYNYPTIDSLSRHLAKSVTTLDDVDITASSVKADDDLIAVIGMGCRFPGAENPDHFWQLLQDGVDAISEVPSSRWDIKSLYDQEPGQLGKMNTRWGGFLKQVDQFDPEYFSISPREAEKMDPQQRLLLEVAWEALQNAGVPTEHLKGSSTGVFIGLSHSNYQKQLTEHYKDVDAYSVTGTALSIAANRLSYLLDLKGPSMTIDTACSSSLVAVHLACQSLKSGESDTVLVGGANVILLPEGTISFSQARMMSADGRCKTFSADADGYSRGEGCGMVVLKRLSDAKRDRDNIRAIIRGSAVNQDGLSNGLTAPNGPAQQAVIRQALKNDDIKPTQISYVEAHGTGTSLGDPIEINSLKEILTKNRAINDPCWVGSVKTNIGHLEAAAGIAGIIKVIMALENKKIPKHLHLTALNPLIDINDTSMNIPTETQAWPTKQATRYAGVSSFGFGGTNSHVIIEEAPQQPSGEPVVAVNLFTLSAKNQKALNDYRMRVHAFLLRNPDINLDELCYTFNAGRSHMPCRLAIIAKNITDLEQKLSAARMSDPSKLIYVGMNTNYSKQHKIEQKNTPSLRQAVDEGDLTDLAEQYVSGAKINWVEYYKGMNCRRIAVPTYPFQRKRHWFESKFKTNHSEQPMKAKSSMVELLKNNNIDQLIDAIKDMTDLSPTELKLLPNILRIIAGPPTNVDSTVKVEVEEDSVDEDILQRLVGCSTEECHALLTSYIQELIANGLGMPVKELNVNQDLNEMGIDSIMAMELRSKVNEDLGINVHILELLLEDTTVVSFAHYVYDLLKEKLSRLQNETNRLPTEKKSMAVELDQEIESADSEVILAKLNSMDEQEIDLLLNAMLADEDKKK